jgi:hypothetical protein
MRVAVTMRSKNSKMNLNDANIAGALGFETRSRPSSLAPTLVTLPSMSRVPRAPFTKTESSASLDRLAKSLAASRRKVRACERLTLSVVSSDKGAHDESSQRELSEIDGQAGEPNERE